MANKKGTAIYKGQPYKIIYQYQDQAIIENIKTKKMEMVNVEELKKQ